MPARQLDDRNFCIKKRQVAAPGCSPIVVFLISKQCKTARSIRAISYGIKNGGNELSNFQNEKVRYKIRPYTSNSRWTFHAPPYSLLGAGCLVAHQLNCLMLLGSPPDMVHSHQLHKTHPSTHGWYGADHTKPTLIRGNHPCCSGLQVQGTAISPAGMAWFHISLFLL